MAEKWYAIYTKPRCEQKAADGLSRHAVETFLPKIEVIRRRKSRSLRQAEPLFPCYVFARIEANSDRFFAAKWTPGVRKVLGVGDALSHVPDSVIECIKKRMGTRDAISPRRKFKTGDRVRILRGPLYDLVGIFEGEISANGRARILMDILRNPRQVEVHLSEIEKECSLN